MKRAAIVLVMFVLGCGFGYFGVAVAPDIATGIGITNVSHYPPFIVASTILAGICFAAMAGLGSGRRPR